MRKQSLNSLKRALDELEARVKSFNLRAELEELVKTLVETYKPRVVVLGGSLAAGRWVKGASDIDLLVITDEAKSLRPTERFKLEAMGGVNVNIAIFTREEVLEGVRSLSFFFIGALKEGLPLYGDREFSSLKAEVEKLELWRTERGWAFRIG